MSSATAPFPVILVSGAVGMMGHGRRYLDRLARGLVAAGCDVHLVVPRPDADGGGAWPEGARVHGIDVDYRDLNADRFRRFGPLAGTVRGSMRWLYGRRFFRRLVDEVLPSIPSSTEVPAALHVLDYEYLTLATLLRRLRSRDDVHTYVTIHPSDFGIPRLSVAAAYKALVRQVLRRALARVDGVVCHGEWIAERLARQLGLRPERLHPLYYPSEARDLRVDPASARRRLGIPLDAPTTLWFGMIRRDKRVDIALDVLAALPDDHHLVIAGHPAEVEPDALTARIHQLGLQDRVHTYLGYVPEDDIPTYFSAADVLLATHAPTFTSASGPVGDARTYRLPVVCGDAGQLGEYVRRFGVGIVVPEDAVSAYASALRAAHERLRDPVERAAWQEAIGGVADDLSWSAFGDAHAAMYASTKERSV